MFPVFEMPLHLPPPPLFTLGSPVASKHSHLTCLSLLRVLAPLLIKCLSRSARSICLHLSCGQGSLLGFPLPSSKPLRTCWQNAWLKQVVTLSGKAGSPFLYEQTLVTLYIFIQTVGDMKASEEGSYFFFLHSSKHMCVSFSYFLFALLLCTKNKHLGKVLFMRISRGL